jgi:hypothetical protein
MTFTTRRTILRFAGALALGIGALAVAVTLDAPVVSTLFAQGCGLRYVATGDDIPAGHDVNSDERYPDRLLADHLRKWGAWCEYDIAQNKTTSTSENTTQLAQTWNYRPDLITLTVGEQNATIVNLVDSCFEKVKSHDFAGASVCAGTILGNSSLWNSLTLNLTTTLQQYRMIMSGRPKLVVAVTGYPNPYPKASDVPLKVVELCPPLIDTIPTCTIRWVQLAPALELLDLVFKKLNSTIEAAVKPFTIGNAGRFVFVNTYDKLRDHCMKMEVSFKTTVEHPEELGAPHEHDSPVAVNFGCSEEWFVAGSDGTDIPFYLQPAAIGVLTNQSQTTKGMGVYPNADGQKCIADLIWEADTIEPGVTPLKWKLSVPEAANTDICN